MINLKTNPYNILASYITAYGMAYRGIQDLKDWYEDLVVKMPSSCNKNENFLQFAKIVWNWMGTQYSMHQITLPVCLIGEEQKFVINSNINQFTRQDAIVYGTPLTGELYQVENSGFGTVIHKLTIGGTA